MVHLFEDCNLCAIHAKRVTISECALKPLLAINLWHLSTALVSSEVSQHPANICSL